MSNLTSNHDGAITYNRELVCRVDVPVRQAYERPVTFNRSAEKIALSSSSKKYRVRLVDGAGIELGIYQEAIGDAQMLGNVANSPKLSTSDGGTLNMAQIK